MGSFDRGLARVLLETCRYTYGAAFHTAANRAEAREALAWLDRAGAHDAPVLLDDGRDALSTSVACVLACADKIVVAYMGTKTEFSSWAASADSIVDWARNLSAWPVSFTLDGAQLGRHDPAEVELGGQVHAGFLAELAAVQAKVVAELSRLRGRDLPLYVTGHSQGGAEAALATRALTVAGFPVAATYTFAAPRAGDAAFVRSLAGQEVHRVEFGNDIVPHLPPGGAVPADVRGLSLRGIPELGEAGLAESAAGVDELSLVAREMLTVLTSPPAGAPEGAGLPESRGFGFPRLLVYAGLGRLCYGDNLTRTLHADLDAAAEARLVDSRWHALFRHLDDWGAHHHLAGTAEEVAAGRKGNYTALVSDFSDGPLVGPA